MINVVLDTNVFISLLLTSGETTSKILYLWDIGKITVYYSEETLAELSLALDYPKLQEYIFSEDKKHLIEKLKIAGISQAITTNSKFCRDPKDDKIINLAISSGSEYLVSGDKDILSLSKNKNLKELKILSPKDFIKEIG